MVYGLEYKLESQIETNSFVNDDYGAMSNSMVRYYTGTHRHPDSILKNEDETDEEFLKWLV